jgi:hypothetical protein
MRLPSTVLKQSTWCCGITLARSVTSAGQNAVQTNTRLPHTQTGLACPWPIKGADHSTFFFSAPPQLQRQLLFSSV